MTVFSLATPALYYSALFFFVTAAAVSGLRSTLGTATALNSTYRINSTVLVALLYLYLADKAYGMRIRPHILKVGIGSFALVLLVFNVESDRGGERVLLLKRHRAQMSMLRWERHESPPSMTDLTPDDLTAGRETSSSFWPGTYGATLPDSIREGIYKLPELSGANE